VDFTSWVFAFIYCRNKFTILKPITPTESKFIFLYQQFFPRGKVVGARSWPLTSI